jgi:1,4-dihydroxy-2-naphthoate octaprenyltransferase
MAASLQHLATAFRLLRIPFSLFLMPIFWFALSQAPSAGWLKGGLIFLILHGLVYPASNGYNSYFDRDEGSIGGLRQPPPVPRALFGLVVAFDLLAVGLSYLLNLPFALMIAAYLLVSKAYSWDRIRLKRWPLISTAVVTLFQGAFIYAAVQVGLAVEPGWGLLGMRDGLLAGVSTLFLLGSYPITQIYQHEEDAARGDRTLSLRLGARGTLLFAGGSFGAATALLGYVLLGADQALAFGIFLACMAPVVTYFGGWFLQVWRDPAAADFDRTMRMNAISSLSLSAAFILLAVLKHTAWLAAWAR